MKKRKVMKSWIVYDKTCVMCRRKYTAMRKHATTCSNDCQSAKNRLQKVHGVDFIEKDYKFRILRP